MRHGLQQQEAGGTLWERPPEPPPESPPESPPEPPAPRGPRVPRAPHNGSATSQAAAARVEERRIPQWQRIVDAVQAAGRAGLTRQEIADRTGILLQAVCARVSELLDPSLGQLCTAPETRDDRAVLVSRRVAIECGLIDPRAGIRQGGGCGS